jgi:hypothetical protein
MDPAGKSKGTGAGVAETKGNPGIFREIRTAD